MSTERINIGLSQDQRLGVVALLKSLLADEYVLYTKTRNFNWNVTGPRFHDLHKFFESQYEAIDETIDEVAERIRSLGGVAPGSLAEFLALARLSEQKGELASADLLVERLLEDHEAVIRVLREDLRTANDEFGDAGTSDFLTGLLEEHEKMAWMLRSLLA